ncbi:MAG: hypothetical protein V4465_02100 [Patescibacteria group bacterium]
MEPKFQSSFIPKGPLTTSASFAARTAERKQGILGYISKILFVLSLLGAVGSFGYVKYLQSSINQKTADLEAARATLEADTISELARLNTRIQVTQNLLSKHRVITPFFDYLESITYKTIKFSSFTFNMTEKGPLITMKGQARGYAAVALQSDDFSKSKYIKSPVFSNLNLDDKGNVIFEFRGSLDPAVLAYKKDLKPAVPAVQPAGTSTPATATTGTSSPATTKATPANGASSTPR